MAKYLAEPDSVQQPSTNQSAQTKSTTKTTTTTTKTILTTTKRQNADRLCGLEDEVSSVAFVEDLGQRATPISSAQAAAMSNRRIGSSFIENKQQRDYHHHHQQQPNKRSTRENIDAQNSSSVNQQETSRSMNLNELVNGNKLVTTLSTIAAQSGYSRLVLVVLKDGDKLRLKIQEMRPALFEVGGNLRECIKYLEEHRKLIVNLRKQKQTPIECWMQKYQKIAAEKEPNMSNERKLIYKCMLENLQGCWRALLNQLDERLLLLEGTCKFYSLANELVEALDKADYHVQVFRQEFLDGPSSSRFNEACNELRKLNEIASNCYAAAKNKQQQLVQLIEALGKENLGDARVDYLISDAQNLINYISTYLEPFEKRRIQLETVISSSKSINVSKFMEPDSRINMESSNTFNSHHLNNNEHLDSSSSTIKQPYSSSFKPDQSITTTSTTSKTILLREINNFNDLNLVDNWLKVKIDQLNSSLLSSLGVSVPDTRSIADKHEQIALECRAIEEATLTFNGRNIHAIKSINDLKDDKSQGDNPLFEQQKLLATRTRDVITILDARLVLLRRSIDFYLRSKEATSDIGKMMRRLQVDNSLQSVQFVSNELELKDVSSVVASGATIISELQQLQLAQQHGERSRIVNLNLATNGIRAIIDKLNQDLANLKTMLNQRRLVLLNEDAAKMANNFSNKCHQLQFWLNNHVKSFLIENNQVHVNDPAKVRQFCDSYEQMRTSVQSKTLEVEALLRSLTTLTEHFDAKSKTMDDIQRNTDELRQDWINATNCLEGRLDLIKKYLAILNSVSTLNKELKALDKFYNSSESVSDERTDEDIRINMDHTLLQLANQVKNFQVDTKKNNTEFVYIRPSLSVQNDGRDMPSLVKSNLNKQQLLDKASELQKRFEDERNLIEHERSVQINSRQILDPAHQRPQQVDPPRFTRVLADQAVEPFKSIELVCELDDSDCQVDWFMNNFKRIPSAIKHRISSEGNQHKLCINNFSSICCGTYLVRASNNAGQATSQCKLKLAGIKETQENENYQPVRLNSNRVIGQPTHNEMVDDGDEEVDIVQERKIGQQQSKLEPAAIESSEGLDQQQRDLSQVSPNNSRAISSSSSFSQWQPTNENDRQIRSSIVDENNDQTISRVIQGVKDKMGDERASLNSNPLIRISQLDNSDSDITIDTTMKTTTTTIIDNNNLNSKDKLPVMKTNYSGQLTINDGGGGGGGGITNTSSTNVNNQNLRVSYIDSPDQVSSTTLSRSVSKSPFDGTPQPPIFVQGLQNTMPRCCSRVGLVCLVMGNPAPTIEWLHNKQVIATAKCSRPASGCPKGNICKLTIETTNPQTEGQYTCRASNRLGKTTTNYTLTNK